jgi:predicted ferric reductase
MNPKLQKTDPIKTVLVITVSMLIVFALTQWKWAFNAAVIIGLLGLLSSFLAKQIDFLWMKLAWVLSLIVPNILLSTIFYLFLTPIALMSRVFGEKNQLNLKNTNGSLFKDYNKDFDKPSFEKPW